MDLTVRNKVSLHIVEVISVQLIVFEKEAAESDRVQGWESVC